MKPLYETDFYTWTKENAQLLRSGKFNEADMENIIEEIESLGRSEKHTLYSHMKNLLMHLLKWKYQHEYQSNSWKYTIRNSRIGIEKVLSENPGLKPTVPDVFSDAYQNARKLAADETGLALKTFPKTCPFSLEQVLDEEFLPEAATGKEE
jgi:hypothetical protein